MENIEVSNPENERIIQRTAANNCRIVTSWAFAKSQHPSLYFVLATVLSVWWSSFCEAESGTRRWNDLQSHAGWVRTCTHVCLALKQRNESSYLTPYPQLPSANTANSCLSALRELESELKENQKEYDKFSSDKSLEGELSSLDDDGKEIYCFYYYWPAFKI